ncbi:extracellular solute-binding protein family 3 [Novosphingobium nitrogenifigens DSM 19370]|uniref:Extracellular solute-binding protein family 3 n=1 Tax=Novosphingobium nitrogenifigens DSM 19370 TaxID=983920 RepID=F1ZAW7_9SPHN|nr:transporter substrate-binding domain-containing protein [Novosphingobium nitrogenifigens]EGD58255.1 extracellular solute-binding protein family 3 [Novosphingobium nitrogenifigens DSM 19370]
MTAFGIRAGLACVAALATAVLGGCRDEEGKGADRVLVVGTEGLYPPWNYTRPDGQLAGFEPDYVRILCARLHRRCRMVAMDWDGMVGALQTGKIDLIADSVQVTPERSQVLGFTRPYAMTTGVFVTLRDHRLAGMADKGAMMDFDRPGPALTAMTGRLKGSLAGKVIGVEISGAFDNFLNQTLGSGASIRYYHTMGERDLDLLNGRIDATLEDEAYMRPLLATRDGAALTMAGPRVIGGAMGGGEALAFRPGDTALRSAFDGAIAATIADGTVRRLGLKWFRMDASPAQAAAERKGAR